MTKYSYRRPDKKFLKEGVVLRCTRPHDLQVEAPTRRYEESVVAGDVALIQKVEAYNLGPCFDKPNLSGTYDLLLLRTREMAVNVPAYQIALNWAVVPQEEPK